MLVTELHRPDMTRMESTHANAGDPSSDTELLRRYFGHGDRDAMNSLFIRYANTAYRVALADLENAADAEEVVQTAFLYVLQHGNRDVQNVRGWIMRIVVSACHDKMKEESRRRDRQQAAAENRTIAMEADRENAELVAAAIGAIKALPEKYRLPVWLHHLEGLTFREVAAALSLPEDAVAQQASRGMEQVRQSLAVAGFSAVAVALPELLGATLPVAPAALTASFKTMIAGSAAKSAGAAAAGMGAKTAAAATSMKLAIAGALLLATMAVAVVFHSGSHPLPLQQDEGGGHATAPVTPPTPPAPAPARRGPAA